MQDSGGPGGLFEPLKQKKVKNDKILFPPEIFCGRCLQRNLTKFFFPQKYSVVDAFKNFEGSEEEKNSMQGYITRAKMTEKAHSSLGGLVKEKRRCLFVIVAQISQPSTTRGVLTMKN